MTKTTNEPNEIICECGHSPACHEDGYGCMTVVGVVQFAGAPENDFCKCLRNRSDVIDTRLSTLEAAVEEQTETIKKLERVEKIAREIFNVVSTSAITRTAEACQHGNYAVPPMNHAWYCDKCWWEMHDALAETAPKVQS